MVEDFKLTVELVPETSWYSNLRKQLPRKQWDRIRQEAIADADQRCAICGADGPLFCHEVWAYDDSQRIQRLAGFAALCSLCHHIKHLGMAGILAREGRLDFERVAEHFLAVNGCSRSAFEKYQSTVFRQWRKRSNVGWTVELGEWGSLIKPATESRARVGHASIKSQAPQPIDPLAYLLRSVVRLVTPISRTRSAGV